jgi:O-antigen ligase
MQFKNQEQKFFFYNLPVILFSLIPVFLITGPFLSDFSISLIGILFLIYCIKEKNFSFFDNKYFYFFLIFWFYLIINSLFNNFNFDSLKISFFYFRYALFVIALVAFLKVNDKFIKYFFYSLFACFILLILDGFYQYFVGENILGFKSPNKYRVTSFFNDEMILGSYISRLWPLLFGLSILFFKKQNKIFYVIFLVFIFSEILIFLSGERVAFFFINFSALLIILLSKNLAKLRIYTLILSLLGIAIITFFNPTAKIRMFDKTIHQMNFFKAASISSDEVYIFTEDHDNIYKSAYKMFLDHKFIGVGVKNYRNICKDVKYFVNDRDACVPHPHNSYLQILTEIGLIGFVFMAIIFLFFLKNIFNHLYLKFQNKDYYSDFEICVLSGISIYLWPFVPTGNVFNNWLSIILTLNLIFLIWGKKTNYSKKDKQK